MNDIIKKILLGEDIDSIFEFVLDSLFKNGPISVTPMEILS